MEGDELALCLHATFAPGATLDTLGLRGEVSSINAIDSLAEHSGEVEMPDMVGDLSSDQALAVFDLGQNMNLNAIAIGLGLENISYEPEVFAGLCYDPNEADGVAVLFGSGEGFAVGETAEARREVAEEMAARVNELGLAPDGKVTCSVTEMTVSDRISSL
jgi:TATA-box binding protein (TBP) (component of TFIID and TFIIIB)